MNNPGRAILLVEDDPNDVLLIKRAFHKAGLTIPLHVVRDPDEAISYLAGDDEYADRATHPMPTLMLLDLKLTGGSGFDVLRWVRQTSGIRRLPIVVLTSSNADRDINQAYDLGANSYVVKPLTLGRLTELVQTIDMYWVMLNDSPDLTA